MGRIYSLTNVTASNGHFTVQDMMAPCKSQTNGSVAIADSAEKEIEIINYYSERQPWFKNGKEFFFLSAGWC